MDHIPPHVVLVPNGPFFNREPPQREATVPPRVIVAMAYLNQLDRKTSKKIAGNDITVTDFPGEELIHEEIQAQASALACLTLYFEGKLKESGWDKPKEEETPKEGQGMRVTCPACHGTKKKTPFASEYCGICQGVGEMLMRPCPEAFK